MDAHKALIIITALADGHDPDTGEAFDKDHVCQHPDTIQALALAKIALRQKEKRRAKIGRRPVNASNPWTLDEETQLLSGFDAGIDVPALAGKHGRTPGAIRSRLLLHGRMEPKYRPWTQDEEQQLLAEFDAEVDVGRLADRFKRTTGAIRSRLSRLGRLGPVKLDPQPHR